MSFRRLRAIARKEVLHVIRDPRSLASAIAIPLIMLLLFGYALSLDVDRIPTIVYDQDHTPQSQELIRDFRGSRYFQIVEEARATGPSNRRWTRAALLGVVIPPDYSRNMLAGGSAGAVAARRQRFQHRLHRARLRRGIVQTYGARVRRTRKRARRAEFRGARRARSARLVQPRHGLAQLHRAGADRRDHDDHHRQSSAR